MTPTTSSSASSPNGETDMNDIDIEEGRRLLAAAEPDLGSVSPNLTIREVAWQLWCENNAAAMFDAIETGRQWETIARRLAEELGLIADWVEPYPAAMTSLIESLAAFRVLANRTPTPTDGA